MHIHKYADYLLKNHLLDFTKDNLDRAIGMELPLLKLFDHLSKEELLKLSIIEIRKYLMGIHNGTALENIMRDNENWVKGELPGIGKEQVELADVIFAHNLRKQSFMKFIKLYTRDIDIYEQLSFELEDFFNKVSEISFSAFLMVQNELLLKEKELNEKIINSFLIGIVTLEAIRDKDGKIVDFKYLKANDKAKSALKWDGKEVYGKKLLEEFPGTKEEGIFDQYVNVVENDSAFNIEFYYPHDDFNRWLQQSGIKWEDGLVVTTLDITEQKENEVRIKLLNSELEKRVKERTKELVIKNKELVKINKDLDNFIYTASHDLKAPVSNIEGLISALEMELSDNAIHNLEIDHILNLINSSVLRFQKTIKDLTEITKFQKNIEEDIEEIHLEELIEDVKASIRNMIQESGAEILDNIPEGSSLKFSKHNFRSILHNLLTNAIKYRSPDRKPKILISFYTESIYSVLEVKDNGLGIAEINLEKIFSMFKRFHTHVEGTGIGLYIVKRVMENCGGKISVKSKIGEGTIFKIYFNTNTTLVLNEPQNKYHQ